MATTSEPVAGERLPLTASQTVGPYLAIGLTWVDGEQAVDPAHPDAVRISGVLLDGEGEPIPDGMVETWQADPAGRFHHPHDPRGAVDAPEGFTGFARAQTVDQGRWSVVTLKPGPLPGPGGPDVTVILTAGARPRAVRHVVRLPPLRPFAVAGRAPPCVHMPPGRPRY